MAVKRGVGRPGSPEKEIDGVLHKQCTRCEEFKPKDTDHFYYRESRRGFTVPCKECRKEMQKERYAAPEVKQYYVDYYEKNRDRILEYNRKRYTKQKGSQSA